MSTTAFSIVCTTCKAKLRVRDTSVIGQILACPKCESMVLIEAPAVAPDDFDDSDLALADGETDRNVSQSQSAELEATAEATGIGWLTLSMGIVSGILLVSSAGAYAWLKWPNEPADLLTIRPAQVQTESALPIESGPTEPNLPPKATLTVQAATSDPAGMAAPQPEEIVPPPAHSAQADPNPVVVNDDESQIGTEAERSLPPDFQPPRPAPDQSNSLSSITRLLTDSAPKNASEAPRSPTAELPAPTLANKSAHASSSSSSTDDEAGVEETEETPIAKQLERRIRAVRFERVPLLDFVRAVTQLGAVPIQIDPAALQQSGNAIDVPVSVASIDASVMSLLRAALEPIRMLPVVEGRGIRITSPRLEDPRLGQLSLFVGDLQAGQGHDLDLATLVSTLIEPDSWATAGGVGSVEVKRDQLVVNHTHAVRIRTLVLLEKLRVARGSPTRNKLPQRYTSLESRWTQVNRYLRRPISMDVWREQPIQEVVQQLEDASGLRIVVDWLALEKLGITIQSTAALYSRQAPAAEVFQQLLGILDGAAMVPISGDTVQITSEAVLQAQPYLEFYALHQLGEAGRAKVEQLMLNGAAALDPASEVAIVIAGADVHRTLVD